MEDINKAIGKRIQTVRKNYLGDGYELTTAQMAKILYCSKDKVLNFENGRTKVTPEILILLYNRGINPIFILTGEGSAFADNAAGEIIKQRQKQVIYKRSSKVMYLNEPRAFHPDELSEEDKLNLISAVAGNILEERNKKNNS